MTLHASAPANRGSLPCTSPALHPRDEFSAPERTRNRADWVWGGKKKIKKKKIIICSLQEKKTLRFLFLFGQYFPVYGLAPPDACLYQGRGVLCGCRARIFRPPRWHLPARPCSAGTPRSWTHGHGRAPAHPPRHPPRCCLKLFFFYFVLFKWKQARTAAS